MQVRTSGQTQYAENIKYMTDFIIPENLIFVYDKSFFFTNQIQYGNYLLIHLS